ncbi:MAG: Asp-tRNA(Asn)/Glu-tRNA(Gln) amidotransferase subunit GatB, partial [Candidatus Wildermuthbacteria bacterium]|nr:Asp-tRNA(Asn)/Glu-tRNA(Gln) amidotransferase subunit GatB [Candidatus Wildermuthbacteria bacterium]
MEYKPTIGLEIHIELNTKSKMFCSCENNPEERRPNFNICPICTAQPGTLPVINQEAVRKTIRTGLALNCQISEYSEFDRKNYFYPDLPKGYQISQLYNPLCQSGSLNKIRIREIHLEEDTGRLIHEKDCSLVDFNRAGVPLMELVTEPDMHSAKEAREFAEELHLIMHYLDVSDADMEKGQMRVEVNISLNQKSKIKNQNLGTKVEIKNLNSFRSVERAVEYEIKRQTGLLDKGEKIVQETRGWLDEATASSRRVAGASELDEAVASSRRVAGAREDDVRGITVSQREKESAHDYRYFPEPDLPPLHFTKKEGDEISSHLPPHSTSWNLSIEEIRAEIPELPRQRKERFVKDYKLDEKNIAVLVYNKSLGEYFETIAKDLSPDLVKLAADFLINTEAKKYNIPHSYFSQLLVLIRDGKISKSAAKEILPE